MMGVDDRARALTGGRPYAVAAVTAADLARVPRRPGPGAAPVRCREGHLIGVTDGAWLWQRHQGRESAAALPAEVRCDRCGRYTTVALDKRTDSA